MNIVSCQLEWYPWAGPHGRVGWTDELIFGKSKVVVVPPDVVSRDSFGMGTGADSHYDDCRFHQVVISVGKRCYYVFFDRHLVVSFVSEHANVLWDRIFERQNA